MKSEQVHVFKHGPWEGSIEAPEGLLAASDALAATSVKMEGGMER